MPSKYTPEQRIVAFWSKVDKSGGDDACWLWTACRLDDGYGRMSWDDGRLKLAHRISYALEYGDCPDELLVLHSCDNPPCVNPKHLSLGTHLDNKKDQKERGREPDRCGEKHPRHKLTDAKVDEIKRLRSEQHLTYRAIASIVGISRQEVGHIIRGENWKE